MQDDRATLFWCSSDIDKVKKSEIGETSTQDVVLYKRDEVVGGEREQDACWTPVIRLENRKVIGEHWLYRGVK